MRYPLDWFRIFLSLVSAPVFNFPERSTSLVARMCARTWEEQSAATLGAWGSFTRMTWETLIRGSVRMCTDVGGRGTRPAARTCLGLKT
jgi:hypothetical protein